MTHLSAQCSVTYPAFELSAQLDLTLDGITAIFGPSGSGKSTLLRLLSGLDRVEGNFVKIDDTVWQDDAAGIFIPPHKRELGFVFQHSALFPNYSVLGNIEYGLKRLKSRQPKFQTEQVVNALDLGGLMGRPVTRLSGGEQQRVALARAVLSSPRLLLMDEPLSSLDSGRKDEILPLIERLASEFQIPILYVSHAIDEVLRLASQLVLVSDGGIVASGPIEAVTSRLELHPYTGRLDAGAVLRATIKSHIPEHGITRFAFNGGEFKGPLIDTPVGETVNLRIRSRDVALSLEPPSRTSILNVLPGRVVQIEDSPGPQAHVLLDIGSPIWARVMKVSVQDLGLAAGMPVYALIKAVAVDRRSLGRQTAMDKALSQTD